MKTFPIKPKKLTPVYLDHAATTPVDKKVLKAMLPFFSEQFANPSALYRSAQQAQEAVQQARETIAKELSAQPDTILFTGSGTESDNLAILGAARANQKNGKHIITSQIEHPAVLEACKQLEQEGFEVTYLPVSPQGIVELPALKKALKPETILVSIMYANNEIGSIQPLADIGRVVLKQRKANGNAFPLFHTDACQAVGTEELSVEKLHVDLLTFNGSKIYGPKGIGVLYKRRGVQLQPLVFGGGQELSYRSGTEDVASIVGVAKALELLRKESSYKKQLQKQQKQLWKMLSTIDGIVLNGPEFGDSRLANNIHVSIPGLESEAVALYLDSYGISVGIGSACKTNSDASSSHVLEAIGKVDAAGNSLRLTVGKAIGRKEMKVLKKILVGILLAVREMQMEK